jgi:hypothetical protein
MGRLQAWKVEVLEEDKLDFEHIIKPLLTEVSLESRIVGGELVSYRGINGDSSNYAIFFWWKDSESLKKFKSHLKSKYNGNPQPEEFKEMYLETEQYFSNSSFMFKKNDNTKNLNNLSDLIKNQEYVESH